jgi:glucuronate isomerase
VSLRTEGRSATDSGALLTLNEDRYFDSDPVVRKAARAIYGETAALPIVAPHGHVDSAIFANNEAFPEPTALIVTPDHYILRMLYSQGIPMERMGVDPRDVRAADRDPRAAWQLFGEHRYLFSGTPTGAWLDYELHEVFGIRRQLDGESAQWIYDAIVERLQSPEFLPRALFDRFNIEVLTTTDAATDSLQHHRAIHESGWGGKVLPCFRPDALLAIASENWRRDVGRLDEVSGERIRDFSSFVGAMKKRREYFRSMGATSTDHAVVEPFTSELRAADVEALFQKALAGEATASDERVFQGHVLMEMARMSTEDGMVMQLHAGSLRNHNRPLFNRFGPDMGADIPIVTEFTRNLQALLNAYGNHPYFTIVLFTLDESTYSRELAPLAGHYPAVRLGPPWWFHDSIEGMQRFRQTTTETAGIYNTAGFNDDTRAFCSIPARHDLSRRVDANFLAGLVSRHIISLDEALEMGRALAYDLVRETYRLNTEQH